METISRTGRMCWGDYIAVCIRQTRMAEGKPLPRHFLAVVQGPMRATPEEYQPAANMAGELFGKRACERTGELLYKVELLTKQESTIAARMDLTHLQKLELIRPLRAAREARSRSYWRRQSGSASATLQGDAVTPQERDSREQFSTLLTSIMDECVTEYVEAVHSAPAREPIPVVAREFDEHLTEAGRIHAHGMSIEL